MIKYLGFPLAFLIGYYVGIGGCGFDMKMSKTEVKTMIKENLEYLLR